MIPTSAALAPSDVTKNSGNSAWIISDEISMNMETKPSAHTVAGTLRVALTGSMAIELP